MSWKKLELKITINSQRCLIMHTYHILIHLSSHAAYILFMSFWAPGCLKKSWPFGFCTVVKKITEPKNKLSKMGTKTKRSTFFETPCTNITTIGALNLSSSKHYGNHCMAHGCPVFAPSTPPPRMSSLSPLKTSLVFLADRVKRK